MRKYPLAIRIAEVRRELALRKAVYPGWVARGKMKQKDANNHVDIMQDVHDTLTWLQEFEGEIVAFLASRGKAA